MEPSGIARGHEGGSRRAWGALLLALGAIALAMPGVAAADPSGGNGNGHGQQADQAADAASASSSDMAATTTTEAVAGDQSGQAAATQEDANGNGQANGNGNGNGNGNAGGNGNGNGNGQQAETAGAVTGAPATATEAGSATPDTSGAAAAPGTTTEQTTAIDQAASATAAADQHGNGNGHANGNANGNGHANANGNNGNGNAYGHGNGNGNASSAVRVDEPGTQAGVSQANQASAGADATATASVETGGSATVAQAADASATATQGDVGNVHVSVRVGSAGDDGTVTQVNQATAASSAAVAVAAGDDGSISQVGSTEAAATAVQEQVTNTVVSVRVLSPGTDGAVSQVNEAAAAASAAEASATAVQDDVRNTYVGIRVGSPGERGPIGQSSGAEADATAGGTIMVVTDGIDTVVTADIVAPELTLPVAVAGETTVWEWIWAWSTDESMLDGAGARLVAGDSWNWAWDDLPGGTVVQREATADELAGTWSWDWSWSREVDGWAWGWAQSAALACTTCAWVWDWDWSWSGQPERREEAPVVQPGLPSMPNQTTNVVSASATSHADAAVVQGVAHDDGAVERFAGQIATTVQLVEASAVASQELGDATQAIAPGPGGGERSLVVVADAAAFVSVEQAIVQLGDVEGAGVLEQWAGQQAEVAQLAAADAVGVQMVDEAVTADGTALASAVVVSDNEQSMVQHGHLGDGLLVQWSGQLTDVIQVAESVARSTQVVREPDASRVASATAASANLAVAAQASVQDGARSAGIGSQTVAQLVEVSQDAGSLATTAQSAESDGALATSNAAAINRSISLQAGTQAMNGASAIDIQDLLQEAIVVQTAYASSSSTGGIGGAARTVNCSTTEQGASQGIGAMIPVGAADLTPFCTPPGPAPVAGDAGVQDAGNAAEAATAAASVSGATVVADDDVAAGHGTRPQRAGRGALRPYPVAHSQPIAQTSTGLAPAAAAAALAVTRSQISSPAAPQARFDSRPEGSSGRKAVERESPLPPTEGPPPWASALAEGLAAFGGSGIAAILLALVLTPPALRRVRDGAVVRRPVSVLAPIDVPI